MNETTRMHKFTPDARQAITFAQQEAERLEHNYIGTEHLLLGLLDVQDSKAVHILTQFHVNAEMVRQRVQVIMNARPESRKITIALGRLGTFTITRNGNAKRANDRRSLTGRARKCISLAVEAAERLHVERIDTEHLLLGIVREGNGMACDVLKNLGIDMSVLEKLVENA